MTFQNPGIKIDDLNPVTTGPLAPKPGSISLDPADMDEVYGQGAVAMSLEDMADELQEGYLDYKPLPFGLPPANRLDRESKVVELAEKYMDKLWILEVNYLEQGEELLYLAKVAREIAETLYPKETL